jgi:hypothetical protein
LDRTATAGRLMADPPLECRSLRWPIAPLADRSVGRSLRWPITAAPTGSGLSGSVTRMGRVVVRAIFVVAFDGSCILGRSHAQ